MYINFENYILIEVICNNIEWLMYLVLDKCVWNDV